ncbi:MAG: PepSY domain-containing protein [Azoarcus sp.]|jgi:outer membrane lipoprotein-sorting protein|nr:PepSY domain-containing protein [Azoarcus sp.]
MTKKVVTIAFCFVACVFLSGIALADRPPPNAKQLSEIVRSLELQGFEPIIEIEFDDGQWEVKAYKEGRKRQVKIDPVTGTTKSDRADD